MFILRGILEYWLKGGWLMIPLAFTCLLIWYFLLKMNMKLKVVLKESEPIDAWLQDTLSVKKKDEFIKLLKAQESLTSKLVLYVIEKVTCGYPMLDVFYEIKQKELAPYERDMTVLKALVAAAPLLGLLGTVYGMISTFQAIAEKSSETTALMASGISQGLLTTEFGLIIAIPGLFGLSLIQKKKERWEGQLTAIQFHLAEGLHIN